MSARFPALSDALYSNEQIDARVRANRAAIDYVLIHLHPGESYPDAVRRVINDPKAPEEHRKALQENHR
jgi:hypothetical protein